MTVMSTLPVQVQEYTRVSSKGWKDLLVYNICIFWQIFPHNLELVCKFFFGLSQHHAITVLKKDICFFAGILVIAI